jgi:lipoprotein-releasing system ATP-binding protein
VGPTFLSASWGGLLANRQGTTAPHCLARNRRGSASEVRLDRFRAPLQEISDLLVVTDLTKEYPTPRGFLPVLSSIHFSLQRGEAASIMGPSGSGKSTLLYVLGTLEPPTSGTVTLDGQDPFRLDERALAAFRNEKVGFVFQDHCLLPQLSVLENVLAPTLVGKRDNGVVDRARDLLSQVGLDQRLDHRPAELSGGEKQRVALARGLIRQPALLLCDEPTGNLDRRSADAVAALLLDLHRTRQTILVVVTHSPELAARFPLRFEIQEQQLKRM